MTQWKIGIIGGSGLYEIDALENPQWIEVSSPWGQPSDALLTGTIAGVECVFLPRHGRGHKLGPSQLNYRANIDAMKRAGVTDLLSISAVGSLQEQYPPGHFVAGDQFIDRTFAREKSFFGEGIVAHVSVADPVCPRLSAMAVAAARTAGAEVTEGGCYIAMEGPQFSTRAESLLYRSWGADIIGMTAMPEAKLAREAELPYAIIGMVTDYDCWREEEEGVDVSDVLAVMHANSAKAKRLVELFVQALPPERAPSPIDTILNTAIITPQSEWPSNQTLKISALLKRRMNLGFPPLAKP
jgi:5'-methylthioadenosine phosphorylase